MIASISLLILIGLFILKISGVSQLSWMQTLIPAFVLIAIMIFGCIQEFIETEIRSQERIDKILRNLKSKENDKGIK